MLSIRPAWHSVTSNNPIYFKLRFTMYFWEEYHSLEGFKCQWRDLEDRWSLATLRKPFSVFHCVSLTSVNHSSDGGYQVYLRGSHDGLHRVMGQFLIA